MSRRVNGLLVHNTDWVDIDACYFYTDPVEAIAKCSELNEKGDCKYRISYVTLEVYTNIGISWSRGT